MLQNRMLHKFRKSVEFNKPHWQSEKWLPIAKAFCIYNLHVGMKVGIYTVSNAVYKTFCFMIIQLFLLCSDYVFLCCFTEAKYGNQTLSCFISVVTAKNPANCANWELRALILSCVEEIMWKKSTARFPLCQKQPLRKYTNSDVNVHSPVEHTFNLANRFWVMHSLPFNPLIPALPVKTIISGNIINIYTAKFYLNIL